ncbi:MAG: flagellin FliC [Candidatus Magasanikbacteria bacterium CG10_big_fil_rev_8_21_14_0_10_47_10]|uniref:Flagellin n=1 Tax=Candidatus Magasanikbacteria bacterium CG10_big_fil_rev_8_21_14_0_10_47_10 TaxID=1974652 RepID=A0A2H0TRX4_9BACT|nr:MAG: flagellin FliC [Candidatus Magasanikbacteria bacterium CG10_big_fil_rev_8_21_14_0_10_47_10]
MGLRIATNIQSIAAQRYLGINTAKNAQTLEKLSSGSRINRAGDDAAGLAISERLRGNIRSMEQATRNAQDGISMIQVSEGAMNEVSNMLIRLRELSIQTASDTIGDLERGFVDKEVQQLKQEMERIAQSTDYNGMKLLNGSGEMFEYQIGIHNDPTNDRTQFDSSLQKVTIESLGIADVSTATKESSQENLGKLDNAINFVNSARSNLGALQNRLQSTINNLQVYHENISAANSRIRDTDMAKETTELVKTNILSNANVAVLAQANQSKQLALKLL